HRGGADPLVEERHLPEVLARAQRGDLLALALHGGLAVEDQEELMTGRPLRDELLPRGDGDLVGSLPDQPQLFLRTRREQPHLRELIQLGITRHVRTICDWGKRSTETCVSRFTWLKQGRNIRSL